jgi:hypothetical protein
MLRLALLCLAAILCSSCHGQAAPKWYEGKSEGQLLEGIRGRPLEQQIDRYLEAMRGIRPPPVFIETEIAQLGSDAVPTIVRKIRHTQDFGDKMNLIMILVSMREMNVFDSCRVPSVRNAILPDGYAVDQSLGRQRYALAVIDLCLRNR